MMQVLLIFLSAYHVAVILGERPSLQRPNKDLLTTPITALHASPYRSNPSPVTGNLASIGNADLRVVTPLDSLFDLASASPSFQCLSLPSSYDPTIFCSGVVDYAFFVPDGLTVDKLNGFALAAGASVPPVLSTPCLADIKMSICAQVYMPCAPNVIPGDLSTYIWNGHMALPFKRPCKSLCTATTYMGNTCAGILEGIGAAPQCNAVSPSTSLPTFDATNDPMICNALPEVDASTIVADKFEPYVGQICQGIVQKLYVPPGSALDPSFAPMLPPFFAQTLLETVVTQAEAAVPRFFSDDCLLAQRQVACSMGFLTPYHVTAIPVFQDFYLPSYPAREVCDNFWDKCADAITLAPSLTINCSAYTSPHSGILQFPEAPQVITVIKGIPLSTPPSRMVLENVTFSLDTQCPWSLSVPKDKNMPNTLLVAGTNCALNCPPDIYTTAELLTTSNTYVVTNLLNLVFIVLSLANLAIMQPQKRNIFLVAYIVIVSFFTVANLLSIIVAKANAVSNDTDVLSELICSSKTSWRSVDDVHYVSSVGSYMCAATGVITLAFKVASYSVTLSMVSELWLRVFWGIKEITWYRYIYFSLSAALWIIEMAINLSDGEADVSSVGSVFPYCKWQIGDRDYAFYSTELPFTIVFGLFVLIFLHVLFICIQTSLQVQVKGENSWKRIWKSYRLMFLLCLIMFGAYSVSQLYLAIKVQYVDMPDIMASSAEYTQCLFHHFVSADDSSYLTFCGSEPTQRYPLISVTAFACSMLYLCIATFIATFTEEVRGQWMRQFLPRDLYDKLAVQYRKRGSVSSGVESELSAHKTPMKSTIMIQPYAKIAPMSQVTAEEKRSAVPFVAVGVLRVDGEGSDPDTVLGGPADESSGATARSSSDKGVHISEGVSDQVV